VIYVGIDTSSTNTAIVILGENKELLGYHLISPKHEDIKVRCSFVVKDVFKILSAYPYRTCQVAIEAPAFMAKGKVIDLSMLVGGVFYGLVNREYSCWLVPPTTHKKALTGSGKASKDDTINALPESVLTAFKTNHKKVDDLADAYSLASYIISN